MDDDLPSAAAEKHPLNLNSSQFDSEAFVSNLLQRKGLDELVAVEEDMVQNVRRLDSEMQQLVYENYNKFLTATNTVRSMQTAFSDMDGEMQSLSDQMKDITGLSESLSSTFNRNRETVRKLTEASKTVERLQDLIAKKECKEAVNMYINARPKLEKYKDVKSMSGIYLDCTATMETLQQSFHESINSQTSSTEELSEAVQLLRLLGHEDETLKAELLRSWSEQLEADLNELDAQTNSGTESATDILEFVNNGGYNFLTNLSLRISLFLQLFEKQGDETTLMEMVNRFMEQFKDILHRRFKAEANPRDCALFVSALDKISRKIAVFSRLLPGDRGLDFLKMNAEIVIKAAQHQIQICRQSIKESTIAALREVIHSLSDEGTPTMEKKKSHSETLRKQMLGLVSKLEQSFLVSVKTCLANLLLFTASDINFTNIEPDYFSKSFGVDVHENIVAGSISDLNVIAENKDQEYYQADGVQHAAFFLVFASLVKNLQSKQLSYLMDLCQEQFKLIERQPNKPLTNYEHLSAVLKSVTECVLRKFVELQCKSLIEFVKENTQSFDWQNCEEPHSVRTSTKELFQGIKAVDQQLCLFGDDPTAMKKEHTPDSLRSGVGGGGRRAASAASNTYETASLNSSIMERLWGDDPEEQAGAAGEVSGPGNTFESALANLRLEFKRDSAVLTAVVRMTLKAMAESVSRLQFSCNGLQQLQVDCGYLKHQLWSLLVDEHMLNSVIEEIVTSAVNQCTDPRLLDPSIVRDICEKS